MKPLSDGSKAVGLFNRELGAMPITLHFCDIAVGETVFLRELWAHKDLAVFKEKYVANVPEHGVVLLKVK